MTTTLAAAPAVKATAASPEATPARVPAYRVHRVRKGQTLWQLARRYQTTVADLRRINNLKKSAILRIGMRLKVPHADT